MRTKIAIVGNGITAGLAANLLTSLGEITLFQSPRFFTSGIPEIIPRKVFFNALNTIDEEKTVTQTAPAIKNVLWRHSGEFHRTKLTSTEQYFVYDKGRLAAFLVENIPTEQRMQQEITHIADLTGFDRIFDCRGTQSVINDPAYVSHHTYPARTACRYLVMSSPPDQNRDDMLFWSETTIRSSRRTFFMIPVGDNRISLGCSCLPSNVISTEELFTAMAAKGIVIAPEKILFSGHVVPEGRAMTCSINHVTPLGDASSSPCPLSEYGTLKALCQIRAVTGHACFSSSEIQRPKNHEIDPHLPQELF
ncbi:protein of unknown function [Xenorhabdus poinarii G6]|uniref:Uncharacterized protein n=1 Tax=Xenorhabdus poinarii G6 TaxID=1354304 RepID=A0A068R4T6_9GAMM|nr:hypothetical protein [Xenorhabdus poinarii]CDG22237.1 protein of unknown function [Xenorhabdus poinarii G6]